MCLEDLHFLVIPSPWWIQGISWGVSCGPVVTALHKPYNMHLCQSQEQQEEPCLPQREAKTKLQSIIYRVVSTSLACVPVSEAIFSQSHVNCMLKHTVPVRQLVVSHLKQVWYWWQLLVFSSATQTKLGFWKGTPFPDKSVHHCSWLLLKCIYSLRENLLTWKKIHWSSISSSKSATEKNSWILSANTNSTGARIDHIRTDHILFLIFPVSQLDFPS